MLIHPNVTERHRNPKFVPILVFEFLHVLFWNPYKRFIAVVTAEVDFVISGGKTV